MVLAASSFVDRRTIGTAGSTCCVGTGRACSFWRSSLRSSWPFAHGASWWSEVHQASLPRLRARSWRIIRTTRLLERWRPHIATVLTQLWRTLWWVDPAAASALSVYIFLYWLRSGRQQIDLIVGRSADPQFLEMVRELAQRRTIHWCWSFVPKKNKQPDRGLRRQLTRAIPASQLVL